MLTKELISVYREISMATDTDDIEKIIDSTIEKLLEGNIHNWQIKRLFRNLKSGLADKDNILIEYIDKSKIQRALEVIDLCEEKIILIQK